MARILVEQITHFCTGRQTTGACENIVRSKNRDMEMVTRELMVVKVDHQLHAQSAEDTRFKTLGRSRGEELQASVRLHR